MANQKLISFDLKAEFGFFKKPDINDGLYLTYNMLHRPALLGILGAIAGLEGYQENGVLPKYYKKLKDLKVGIEPLDSDKGNYTKDIVRYNNSTGFASDESGGNLIVTEQILIKPAYRCYLLLDIDEEIENKLYVNLKSYQAEFLPYMGKNDFSAWWENFTEYSFSAFDYSSNYIIASIFSKTEAASKFVVKSMSMFLPSEPTWLYFEKIPVCFDEQLFQYSYADFVYSNAKFSKDMNMSEAGKFYKLNENTVIQLT